jgi:serine/threonine-protein kinase
LLWLGMGVLFGLAVGWIVASLRGSPQVGTDSGEIMRFAIHAPRSNELIRNLAAAPDDRHVVYEGFQAGVSSLHLHDFESGNARLLEGTEGGVIPFLSPDGRWVGFRRDGDLMKLRLAGGDAVKICDVPWGFPGASWGPDGTILFARGWLQGLWSVSADGGEPVALTKINADAGEKGHWWPRFLPGGRHALFTIWNAGAGLIDAEVALLDVQTGEYRKLVRGADSWFLPPGQIVFYRAGSYHAIRFDPDALEVVGDPVPVLEDAADPEPQGSNAMSLAISARGTLFYSTRQINPPVRLAVVEEGAEPRLLPFPPRAITGIGLSPDGRTLAVSSLESGVFVIRLLDAKSGTDERVELSGSNWDPFWQPDGSGFAFLSMRKGDFDIYFKDVRSGGPERPVRVTPTDEQPLGWSIDGSHLFVRETSTDASPLLKAVPVDGTGDEPKLIGELLSQVAAVSPDGGWLAYDAFRGGVTNTYVRPYPGPGGEVRVSLQGGRRPAWSPDGSELYYDRSNSIVAISYTVAQGRFQPGTEEVLFESPLLAQNITGTPLAVLGRRSFVVTLLEAEPEPPQLQVVLNWQREVAARLAAE